MKTYVTFGQDHVHHINGDTFDRDCVAAITSNSAAEGRDKAFQLFGSKFCFEYPEDYFNFDSMHYYPRGFIDVE